MRDLAVTLLTVVTGCVASYQALPNDFHRELTVLETRVAQGRYEEALVAASALEQSVSLEKEKCEVFLAKAKSLAGLRRAKEALAYFRKIEAACQGFQDLSAKALFEMGVMLARLSGEADAIEVFRRVAFLFPEEPTARRAIVWAKEIVERCAGPEGAILELQRIYRVVGGSELGAYVLFQAADVLAAQRKDTRLARLALYYMILTQHRESHFADDAILEASKICISMGYPLTAARLLVAFLNRRETSWFIGSYDTPAFAEAGWLLAEALETAGERGLAAKAYSWFAKEFPRNKRAKEAISRAWRLETQQ